MRKTTKEGQKKTKSIIYKINNSVLAILVPSLIVLIAVSCTFASKAVSAQTSATVSAQSNMAVLEVDAFFRNKITAISMFEHNAAMQTLLKQVTNKQSIHYNSTLSVVQNTLSKALESMKEEGVQDAWLASIKTDSYIMASGEVEDAGLAEEEWTKRIQSSRKAVVSEPFLDPVSNKTVISIASPVFSDATNDIIGYAGFDVYQDSLAERLSQIKIGQEGYIELVSNENQYIYSDDAGLIGADIGSVAGLTEEFKQKVRSDYRGNYRYKYDNIEYDAVFDTSKLTEWLMIANIPVKEVNAARNQLIIAMILLSAAALVVLIIGLVIRITKLIHPIKALAAGVETFANGNLDVEISVDSDDEIGLLAQSVQKTILNLRGIIRDISHVLKEISGGNLCVTASGNYMGDFLPIREALSDIVGSLNRTMTQISNSSDQVASGSEQVSSGAQALSQGATEQASSVQELAATVNEISEQVKGTAANAQDASRKAEITGHQIMESNRQMQQMLEAMNKISESSGQIGKIIKTIEDIAFQTNILALNAAVEAARAGAAGKGFAVVADEVRNLAGKSSEASRDTSGLIAESLKAVENGTVIANTTARSLLETVEAVKEVNETIGLISEASGSQATSISQVTQGIDQISNVVQTNSATAEESAAASEELSGQAQLLKQLVSQFTLESTAEDFIR